MLGLRGIPVIWMEKVHERLGYTRLEFGKKVWAGNVNFRVSVWLAFGAG